MLFEFAVFCQTTNAGIWINDKLITDKHASFWIDHQWIEMITNICVALWSHLLSLDRQLSLKFCAFKCIYYNWKLKAETRTKWLYFDQLECIALFITIKNWIPRLYCFTDSTFVITFSSPKMCFLSLILNIVTIERIQFNLSMCLNLNWLQRKNIWEKSVWRIVCGWPY